MAITVKLPRPPHTAPDEFSRADLEFRGVDHSGPTLEARVYLNNTAADVTSGRAEGAGYAGSFYVFGHGGCFGELGHCDIPAGPRGTYDYRLPHQLTPQFKTIVITDALQRLMRTSNDETFTVTVVAVVYENPISTVSNAANPLKFESVSLITREDPAAAGIPLPPRT